MKFSETPEISFEKLYFRGAGYHQIIVGFAWKVDGQRGEILKF